MSTGFKVPEAKMPRSAHILETVAVVVIIVCVLVAIGAAVRLVF